MITKIRSFDPGDMTSYNYAVQFAENRYGTLVHMFSFGVNTESMTTVEFPTESDFIDYDYFAQKFERRGSNIHTTYVAYIVFCWITSRRAEGHQSNPTHGRQWNFDWTDQLEFDLGALA